MTTVVDGQWDDWLKAQKAKYSEIYPFKKDHNKPVKEKPIRHYEPPHPKYCERIDTI